jgi:ACR3 family arsenite efflux pump ArsB
MACPNCGIKKIENANFCINCGYQLSKDSIEEFKDSYQVNVALSTVLGVCTGVITGLFSAAIQETIHMDWWGWVILIAVMMILLAKIIFDSFKTVEKSVKRQMRRREN